MSRDKSLPGWPIRSVVYSLQGNEEELAYRVFVLMGSSMLKPDLYRAKNTDCLYVVASCTNLGDFFTNKETMLTDTEARRASI